MLSFEFERSLIKMKLQLVTHVMFLLSIAIMFLVSNQTISLVIDTDYKYLIVLFAYSILRVCFMGFQYLNKIYRLSIYQKFYDNNMVYVSMIKEYPLRFIVSTILNGEVVIKNEYNLMIDSYVTNLQGRTSYNILDRDKNIVKNYEVISFEVNNMINEYNRLTFQALGSGKGVNEYWKRKSLFKYAIEIDKDVIIPYINKDFTRRMSRPRVLVEPIE